MQYIFIILAFAEKRRIRGLSSAVRRWQGVDIRFLLSVSVTVPCKQNRFFREVLPNRTGFTAVKLLRPAVTVNIPDEHGNIRPFFFVCAAFELRCRPYEKNE